MSTVYVYFAPRDPQAVPDEEAIQAAAEVIDTEVMPTELEIVEHSQPQVTFGIEAGCLGEVACPWCAADVTEWLWSEDVVGQINDKESSPVEYCAPCCGRVVSLVQLLHAGNAALATLVFEAQDPDLTEIPQTLTDRIGTALGTPVIALWHYV
jgi:hypothetical protein